MIYISSYPAIVENMATTKMLKELDVTLEIQKMPRLDMISMNSRRVLNKLKSCPGFDSFS